MKKIAVQYFAALREQRGLASEELQFAGQTVLELYQSLKDRHGFAMTSETMRVAINDEFKPWSTVLVQGDVVTFIPPVAGG